MNLGKFGALIALRRPRIKKTGTLSSELQEAKSVEEIRLLKPSMFLAQKYPSRWSVDDTVVWRGSPAKEPGRKGDFHLLDVYIPTNSFSKTTFSSKAIFT